MRKIAKSTSLLLVVMAVLSFGGCLKYTSNILDVTLPDGGNVSTTVPAPVFTTAPNYVEYTTVPMVTDPVTTLPTMPDATTQAQIPTETTTAPQVSDPSTWSTQQAVSFAKDAVNKTKAFTGNVTAKHTENVTVTVTKAPGGSLVSGVVNRIIGGVVDPTDETLSFAGGKATNSEGESVQLLLPVNGAFTLDASGVSGATAKTEGANTVVTLKLVSETGTLTTPPKNNAASIGYLNASTLDLSGVTINYLDVTYTGSTITLTVNPQGYVVSAAYSMPLKISAEGKALGITAQIEADGLDSENWTFNW